VQLARERYSLMKQAQEIGAETGLSIGYQTIKSEPDKEQPSVRRLKELRLLEYSVVVFPMNPSASIETVKKIGADPLKGGHVQRAPTEPGHSFGVRGLVRALPLGDSSPKSLNWEPVVHSLVAFTNQLKTINKEYSQCQK
jgi:hypothetical protein